MNSRNRTPSEYIGYGLYFYFSGLSLRRTSERLACFVKRNHVSIWNWIQKYNPQKIASKKKKVDEFVIDETVIKVGSKVIWLWVAIEPKNKQILALTISKEGKCLWQNDSCRAWLGFMEGILFQRMGELGIQWLVDS